MKKIIPLLLLCLLLTACQDDQAPTSTSTQPRQSTAATTVPTTVPPASTAAPTKPTDPRTNTINNAKKITVGMTREDVYELLHIHGETLFQNVSVQRWDLDNGKFLYVWFHPTENSTNTNFSDPPYTPDETYVAGGYDICDQRQGWPGDYTPTAEDVAQIQKDMSMEQVLNILGIGYKDVGSGLFICKWLMDDGNEVFVWLTGGTVSQVRIAPAGEEKYMGDTYSKAEYVANISVGMTYYDVSSNLQGNSVSVCYNAEVVQYLLLNGGYVQVWYAEIDGVSIVCKVEIGGALA